MIIIIMTLPNGGRSRTQPAYRIATPPQHGGRAYHVSPTGSDSDPGSEARPFRTIQRAADSIKPGDTVIVD
ncbi:MAG TPA: hypothetical protein VG324_04965, partial [Blastocatellia bacterium]|nr:hypothetical protein [Blastocatellia bacterium]